VEDFWILNPTFILNTNDYILRDIKKIYFYHYNKFLIYLQIIIYEYKIIIKYNIIT